MERDQDEPQAADAEKLRREGEANRKELDDIPPPGTDPLHEGP
jgi:hypothetical protein